MRITRTSKRIAGCLALGLWAGCNLGPITLPSVNQNPTANAGPDRTICLGAFVDLDALGSTDPDGDSLSYVWTQTTGPRTVDLSSGYIGDPSFEPTQTGMYEFSVTVNDDRGGSDDDAVRVIVVVAGCDDCPTGHLCCHEDAECDDGAYCNGAETCVNGECVDGITPCSGDTPVCLEDTDECVACETDADCGTGQTCVDNACETVGCATDADCENALYCDGAETCVEGACTDGTAPCADPTPVCVEEADECVECDSDDDCDDGDPNTTDRCVDGVCEHDSTGADCVEETLSKGDTVSGEIDPTHPTEEWIFCGQAGEQIRITVAEAATDYSFEPSLVLVRASDGGGEGSAFGGCSAAIDRVLSATGTYAVRVSDRTGTNSGSYYLTLIGFEGQATSPDDPDGGQLEIGESVNGTINPASDLDLFSFEATAGQLIHAVGCSIRGSLCPALRLYAPDGADAVVPYTCSSDDEGNYCRIIDVTLEEYGMYHLVIESDGACRTGSYGLRLENP